MPAIEIAAFYKFARLPDFAALREPAEALCHELGARGTLLLAEEGLNGTLAAPAGNIEPLLSGLEQLTGIGAIERKYSHAKEMPFLRLKVRLKAEIVTIGDRSVDPTARVGTYVEPEDWNALISDPDVIVIDTRNDFEVELGSFKDAINPATTSFSEFPDYVRRELDPARHRKVAMFCTGGIRCEKASSFMLGASFEEVYHLKGGILNYLEKVPEQESLWQGGCFVFDERVSIGHGLVAEYTELCAGCRRPISEEIRQAPAFEEGVCCPRCADTLSERQKASARERWRQTQLAEKRGGRHLGPRGD